jgi:hypothetical protein
LWLGCGVSGFRAFRGTYPHNLVLETAVETGLVGTGLLCLVMVSGAWAFRRLWRSADGATLAAFAFALVASQLSGDLFDSRGVFLFLLMALIPVRGQLASCRSTCQEKLVRRRARVHVRHPFPQPTRAALPRASSPARAPLLAAKAFQITQPHGNR